MPNLPLIKCCSKCNRELPATNQYFGRDGRSTRHPYQDICRECASAIKREMYRLRHADVPEGHKKCKRCSGVFPNTLEYFCKGHKRCKVPTGCYCKPCAAVAQKEYRDAHPEYVERVEKSRDREERRARSRDYHRKHAVELRARHRQYIAEHPEVHRAWCAANPDRLRALRNRRRARLLAAEGTHTQEDIRSIYAMQKGKCWWCGKKIKGTYHVDHRIPLSRGGGNGPENLVIACPHCNTSKGGKMPHEWIGRLL